jgi:pimeloyl-ACP methyl ester carboxylesterase
MCSDRSPVPDARVREVVVRTARGAVSGLLAEPADDAVPRGLVVAIHGAGMHAGYFHPSTAPELSLLDLGSRLGFTVWAPDRPGIGGSAGLPAETLPLYGQADLLHEAIGAFTTGRDVGAGVFVVAHSYGLKVAWAMAADPRGADLLGIDGAGSGIRYAFTPGTPPTPRAGERGPAWGPERLYPPGTFARRALPLAPVPPVQAAETALWPDQLRSFASRIRAPMRLTLGEHERLWQVGKQHATELRAVFTAAERFTVEVEPGAGHNVSLGWAARAYHLKALAFAEACIAGRRVGRPV